jgi:Protein of unknown function (DUF1566)
MKTEMIIKAAGALLLMLVTGATEAVAKEQTTPCGPGTSGHRFVLFDSGTTVCDNTSGVMWERTPLYAQRTFAGAQAYCAAKGPGWQLPDVKDFLMLVDYANSYPPLPSGHPFTVFNSATQPTGVVSGEYFTRTPMDISVYYGSPDTVWSFIMDRGRTFEASISGTSDFVWCVK